MINIFHPHIKIYLDEYSEILTIEIKSKSNKLCDNIIKLSHQLNDWLAMSIVQVD